MRFKMDLYANVRPVRLLDAALCPLKGVEPKDVDFVVIRENTEGVYSDRAACSSRERRTKSRFRKTSTRARAWSASSAMRLSIARRTQSWMASPRRRVLMCDKSNAMTHAGGLWQRVFKEVGGEYPQIETQHMYVDALCMQMVRDPRQFDVIVTNNMFGDIITDLAAGPAGRAGHGGERQYASGQDFDVRAGARFGAADCRGRI